MCKRLLFAMMIVAVAFLTACTEDCTEPEIPAATGTVQVSPPADGLGSDAAWTLDGPNAFRITGSGQMTMDGLASGSYVVTWGSVTGWITPAVQTIALAEDQTIVFSCTYALDTSLTTVSVVVVPATLDAPWSLSGPDGYTHDGIGSTEVVGLDAGDYTVNWGHVEYHTLPAAETIFLDSPRIEFVGEYSVDYPFAGTPEQLMANFETANAMMDDDAYVEILDPGFVILLQNATIIEFGLPRSFFDYAEDVAITERMFSGTAPGEGVGAISAIDFLTMVQASAWQLTPNPSFPGAIESDYNVDIRIDNGDQLEIRGRIRFFLSSDEVEHEGEMRTRYRMLGQIDETGAKAAEDVSWGSVKALYR